MRFVISPDPAKPDGGWALLALPADAVGEGRLRIRRLSDDRHLGPQGWQPSAITLGPFDVSVQGVDALVTLGPEVVAHMQEYVALEIAVEGGPTGQATWPEDVLPPPREATAGGLRSGPLGCALESR